MGGTESGLFKVSDEDRALQALNPAGAESSSGEQLSPQVKTWQLLQNACYKTEQSDYWESRCL